MKTTTPFDLNQAIQNWRENLAQSPAFRRENLDELETHLRDSVVTLQARGLSVEESLLIATKRLGGDNALTMEFGKVNTQAVWFGRILWALLGIQLWNFAGVFTSTLAGNAVFSGLSSVSYNFDRNGMLLPVALLTVANFVGFAGFLGLCWWLIRRYRETLQRRLRTAFMTRGILTLTLISALALVCFGALLVAATRLMPLHYYSPKSFEMYSLCGAISSNILAAIKIMALVPLTLYLTRKKLHLSKA